MKNILALIHQTFRNRVFNTLALLPLLGFVAFVNGQSYEGYTLYFPQNGTKAYLIDLSGNTYHSWTFATNMKTTYSTYLLEDGVLLRTVSHAGNYFNGGPISGEVQKVDWNGNILWDFVYSTQEYCTHHDICALPNGNVLMIAYERKSATEVVAAGGTQSIEMWPDKIVEVQPTGTNTGTVVWEWHFWDHLIQDHDATKANYGVVGSHPELVDLNYKITKDWIHMNGLDYNAALDQIAFSSHNLNEIYVIDHSTTTAEAAGHSGGNSGKGGDILYRWGNPLAYRAPGTANFNTVHDAHWISADDPIHPNMLSGYNNHGGSNGKTCVDVFNPPYNGYNYSYTPGTAYAPTTYSSRITYSGAYSSNNGNAQQLPNGNTLICIGMSGYIYEADQSGNTVWSKTVGGQLPQSFRYPPCYITGIYTADASAQSTTLCSGQSTQLDVTVTGGEVYIYSWASIPAGFTANVKNPTVSPTVTTTYYVTVKNGPCSATDSVTVTVNPVPAKPTISEAGDSLVSSSSAGNQWYKDGTILPGATNQFYVPTTTGSFQVTVTIGGCTSPISEPYLVAGNVEKQDYSISIYPNPSRGVFKILYTGVEEENLEVSVYDLVGNRVVSGTGLSVLDLSGHFAGIYFVKFRSAEEEMVTKKIVIVN
jgi:hypothetical protein